MKLEAWRNYSNLSRKFGLLDSSVELHFGVSNTCKQTPRHARKRNHTQLFIENIPPENLVILGTRYSVTTEFCDL